MAKQIWSALKWKIIARDEEFCQICGKKIEMPHLPDGRPYLCYGYGKSPFHIDHIIPVSKGGKTTEKNLQLACAKCNMQKGNRIL